MSSHAHRPDIDGLRALAIVPVVLYHVGARGCFGGFVGVDVFFVISGFLISTILFENLAAGRFSQAESSAGSRFTRASNASRMASIRRVSRV